MLQSEIDATMHPMPVLGTSGDPSLDLYLSSAESQFKKAQEEVNQRRPVFTNINHRSCKCGLSGGMYKKDGRHAIIDGQAIPIGIDNYKFQQAIDNQEEEDCGYGTPFAAFIIAKGSAKIEVKQE